MSILQNLRIIAKIATVVATLILVSLVVAFMSYTSSSTQMENADMTEHTHQVLAKFSAMMGAMIDQETGMRGFLIAGDRKFLEPQIAGASAFKENLQAAQTLTADNPAQQTRLKELAALAETWTTKVVNAELELMKDPANLEKARQIEISGVGKASMDGIRAKIKELSDVELALLSTRSAASDAAGEMARLSALVGGGAMLLVSGLGLLLLNVSLVRPLRNINAGMLSLARGQNHIEIPGRGRKDEIGEMAEAVEVFRQTAIKKIEADQQALEARSASEAERARNGEAARARAAEMEEATSGLAEGLRNLADGNLSFQLTRPFAQEFEGLRRDFNTAVAQLKDTLSLVANSTGSIDTGSRELSQSANDLSKRTEQQAASLEETAAALDQITANVSNASKRTDEARGVAIEANRAAQQSGQVVANAVDAMQRIEQSSSQISNIIGVIDEIAFQTNLLALNAGVEAARAGEAGKGFAVVAQEVRELAQRSAQAAKEIKELIRTSADQVENGVKLVTATGDALKVIEGHVVAINSQLDAIATSAKEQSVGLSEVNTAVNQMDQVTQQNAAMVEEATAASTGLAGEAEKLRQLIARFQLQGATAVHAPMVAAATRHAAAPSPARRLVNKVARAMGGGGQAAESWEEF
ncbi:methyl-accepting chemotaxis protein [Allorhizobium pseudoryzae]|uniref:methyl-accepting chemotaxis protein n=1 Tax=Allorhizobium pseudoryzae TaxID=379684 RepID=UPI003D020B52